MTKKIKTLNHLQKIIKEKWEGCAVEYETPDWLIEKIPKVVRGVKTPEVFDIFKDKGNWIIVFHIDDSHELKLDGNKISLSELFKKMEACPEFIDSKYNEDYDDLEGDSRYVSFEISLPTK